VKLLRVIATLDARHGGPSAGLRAITPELARLGHETTFVSMDAPGQPFARDIAAPFFPLGPAHGGYGYSARLAPWLRQHAKDYDAVFVHGLWQYHGRAVRTALRGTSVPYFVFPHGMLDPWFRHAYPLKHVKKWIYWQLIERKVLRDAAAVFFTCEEERRLARESFSPYSCNERVVAYGTSGPPANAAAQRSAWQAAVPELVGRPFWLFLGRIHPKKGVDLLLRSYGEHARRNPTAIPALVVAGPCSDERYRAELTELSRDLPAGCSVIWPGMLEGEKKWGALRSAEVFVLPSHQENFGIAVVEALAVGTPVLISRKVNIWDEIESEGAGFADSDDVDGTRRLLDRWRLCSAADRQAMRQAATQLFSQRYEIGRVARSLVESLSPFLRSDVRELSHEIVPPEEAVRRFS
jgi:glycosyltransferase involved in cell wall biosynthesis